MGFVTIAYVYTLVSLQTYYSNDIQKQTWGILDNGEFTYLRLEQSTNRYTARSTCDRSRDQEREHQEPSLKAAATVASPTNMWRHLLETDDPIKTV